MLNSIQSIIKELKEWENDFYEVLPIVCSSLTNDAKVARIKKIFDFALLKAYEEGKEETLAKIGSDYDKRLISKAREEALEEAIETLNKRFRYKDGQVMNHFPIEIIEETLQSLKSIKEKT